jgi:hypothetical protein
MTPKESRQLKQGDRVMMFDMDYDVPGIIVKADAKHVWISYHESIIIDIRKHEDMGAARPVV